MFAQILSLPCLPDFFTETRLLSQHIFHERTRINRYRPREAQIPTGFRVRYLDYDKRLNRQQTGASNARSDRP